MLNSSTERHSPEREFPAGKLRQAHTPAGENQSPFAPGSSVSLCCTIHTHLFKGMGQLGKHHEACLAQVPHGWGN